MRKISLSRVCFFSVLLLGFLLRIYKLGESSLWSDEVQFMPFRSGNLSENLKFVLEEIPRRGGFGVANYGYNLFSIIWSCFVRSEFGLRLTSVIFGAIGIILIYKVGELFFDKKTGLAAAFLLAVSPFHIYYAQEFRMYTLIALLTLSSAYFLRRFQLTGKDRFLYAYIISHAVNFYMHIVSVLILAAQIIFFLSCRSRYQRLFKKWLIGNIAILILLTPGIAFTVMDLMHHKDAATILSIAISSTAMSWGNKLLLPLYTFKNFSVGYSATKPVWVPAVLLYSVLFILALKNTRNREALNFCLFCLLIPTLTLYIGQRFLYSDRYLIPSSIFLYLILSNGAAHLKRRFAVITLMSVAILAIFSLSNHYRNYLPCPPEQRWAVHEKKAVREAAAHILGDFHEEDIIFHIDTSTALPFEYYFNYYFRTDKERSDPFDEAQIGLVLEFFEKGDDLSVFRAWSRTGRILQKSPVPVIGHNRVWVVFSAREFKEAVSPGSRELRKLEWMERQYALKDVRYFKGIILYLFGKPGENKI